MRDERKALFQFLRRRPGLSFLFGWGLAIGSIDIGLFSADSVWPVAIWFAGTMLYLSVWEGLRGD